MLVLYVNENKSHDNVPCSKAKSRVINPYIVEHFAVNRSDQCCGSVTFWYGSESTEPYF
jgi:hypothetical protein